ncbi:unnamed protein product [Caenorhabditis brenneri]
MERANRQREETRRQEETACRQEEARLQFKAEQQRLKQERETEERRREQEHQERMRREAEERARAEEQAKKEHEKRVRREQECARWEAAEQARISEEQRREYLRKKEERRQEQMRLEREVEKPVFDVAHRKTDEYVDSHIADLNALEILHSKLVDTAELFDERQKYPPLKKLAYDILNKRIHGSMDDHDSAVNAAICMDIIIKEFHMIRRQLHPTYPGLTKFRVLIIPTKTKDIIISELEIKVILKALENDQFVLQETGTNEQEEKEEVYDDQAAQPLAFNTTRIKEEMVVPDYEKSLNDLKIDYEKIRAVFDTQRNIELPWSRESPKWQEFMTAFRSGDTIRSEQLRIEIMAEDKKKKQAESHATVGMDLRDIADEEDDTEEMEDLNNNPPLNAQNILTQEELDAGFHEQMEIYNRLCDQNLLAGSSLSSGNELEPENVAAFNEDRIRRYSLRRAAKKTIKAEKNAGRKGEPKKEKSTAKPKRAKKQSQKNEVPRVESRATRRSQTAEDEPRKLRSRK